MTATSDSGIGPHSGRLEHAAVGEADGDLVGRRLLDDVIVGQDVDAGLAADADEDAGAGLIDGVAFCRGCRGPAPA